MMRVPAKNIEDFIGSILRGAAKILGCSSANLILLNAKAQEVRVLVGASSEQHARLSQIESVFGNALQATVFSLKDVEGSLIFTSWRDRAVCETSNIAELVANAFPESVTAQVSEMLNNQRFICVPVVCSHRVIGVIIFTKEDLHPFGLQQREILLRYAQRIGEIIENDLKSRGSAISLDELDLDSSAVSTNFLFDHNGHLTGSAVSPSSQGLAQVDDRVHLSGIEMEVVEQLAHLAKNFHASATNPTEVSQIDLPIESPGIGLPKSSPYRVELSKLWMNGEQHVLCSISQIQHKSVASIQNQLLYFALGDTAPALLVDPTLNITSCNEATSQVFGYNNDELLHQPIQILFSDPADIQTILDHQFLFLSNGYFEEVSLVRSKNGRIFPGRIEALLLVDENSRVIGFLVLVHDQSVQAEAFDAEDSIHELMRRERLATIGEMAAQLAHEIRNPLVSIGSTLEMLSKDSSTSAECTQTMSELSREVTHLDTILQDYLSLAARRNAKISKVDIASIIDDSWNLMKGMRENEGRTITSSIEKGIDVFADYTGLRQVVVNLLRNAAEATPRGGTIKCSVEQHQGEVVIQIDDQGQGLSASPSDCFKPFFTTKKNGTGLGLTVCQKIVESHGGRISLENREQGGCRASVILRKKVAP